jgi:hypothetical protein
MPRPPPVRHELSQRSESPQTRNLRLIMKVSGSSRTSCILSPHGVVKAVLEINTKKYIAVQVCHLSRCVNFIINTLLHFSWISCHRLFTLISIDEPLTSSSLHLSPRLSFHLSLYIISLPSSGTISKQTPLPIYLPV